MADIKLKLLGTVPLFARCGGKDLERIGQLAEEIDVPAGKVLMRQGELGREFFLIVSGKLKVERDGQILRTLGPGDFAGEIALISEGPRSATVTAETDSRVLVLARREFNAMLDEYPEFRRNVMAALADRVSRLEPDQGH